MFTVDGAKVQLWVDGDMAAEGVAADAGTGAPRPAPGLVRIGAAAESGLADHFLDGDVSDVALFARRLSRHEVVALTALRLRGRSAGQGTIRTRIRHAAARSGSATRWTDCRKHRACPPWIPRA